MSNMNVFLLAFALGKPVVAVGDLHCPVYGVSYTLAPINEDNEASKSRRNQSCPPCIERFMCFL
jgi:hypothetical protein